MARGKKRERQPNPQFGSAAEAIAIGETQTEVDVSIRAAAVEENLESGSAQADSTWFLRHLTDKQRIYGLKYVQCGGNWQKAAEMAGYSPNTTQGHIESGDAMVAYMKAIKAELSAMQGISAHTIIARLNRIALKTEEEGDVEAALRANTKLGEILGLFQKNAVPIQINAEGAQIVISGPRSSIDDALRDDPEVRAILAHNGMDLPVLPGEIVSDQSS